MVAKSFARIHRSNLINSGILPLVLKTPTDYDEFDLGDELIIKNAVSQLDRDEITMENISNGKEYTLLNNFSPLEKNLILAGGKINYIKSEN